MRGPVVTETGHTLDAAEEKLMENLVLYVCVYVRTEIPACYFFQKYTGVFAIFTRTRIRV